MVRVFCLIIFIIIVIVIIVIFLFDFDEGAVNLYEKFVLLLADGVSIQQVLKDDPVPELHPLREHPMFLLVLQPNLQIDAGRPGVLSHGPDDLPVSADWCGVPVLRVPSVRK